MIFYLNGMTFECKLVKWLVKTS